jgi:hypothetical protein
MKYFKVLNEYVRGQGDPKGKVWFVGLEESEPWTEQDLKQNLELYKKDATPLNKNELCKSDKKRQNDGERYTPINLIMSKIIVRAWPEELPKNLYQNASETDQFRYYKYNRLRQRGSGTFQVNIYPLGKKNRNSWDDNYQKLFGFGPEDQKAYYGAVRDKRFPNIRKLWKDSEPKITICFGKEGWHDFRLLFELDERPDRIINDGKKNECCIYEDKRIILTPFFFDSFMNTDTIGQVVDEIKAFTVI